jgi:hypothetical protein
MSTSTLVAGRYRLQSELGRGGMGVVWHGYDELLHRDVAVKELHFPADLSADERERLAERTLREARAVAAVDTPAAVRVFDIVEQDGRPWIVMELVRGRSLTAALHEVSVLPPREVARIGLALVEALQGAHAAGVLHRDVKPGNVLLGEDGRVALTDFGIATVDGDAHDTTGVIVGSPAYVAPERVTGRTSSPASDVWSLGATLWTAAEGRPPYAGDSAVMVLQSVAHADPPRCTRCTGELADVIRRMMDRDPDHRPDLATVRAALQRVAAGRDSASAPTEAYPTERTQQLPAAFDRTTVIEPGTVGTLEPEPTAAGAPRRTAWVLAAVVAILLATGVGAAVLLGGGSPSSGGSAGHRTNAPGHGSGGAAGGSTGNLPAGWTRYTDPDLGWSVGVPKGWSATTQDNGTKFTDPAGGRYLLVGTRYPAGESAVRAWQAAERTFRSSHAAYQRLRIEPVQDAGADDAADWEFLYTDSGARLHALDRGLVFGHRGYALFFQTHADQWDASQSVWQRIDSSFRPG